MYLDIRRGNLGTAVFDKEDVRYRYLLTRCLDEGDVEREGSVGFVMLNPSEADENQPDHSVGRCITFANNTGCRTLEVGNLYAWYGKKPTDLLDAPPPRGPIGPHNDACLFGLATRCSKVVAAWGKYASKKRANHVLCLLWEGMEFAGRTPRIHRLGSLTRTGHPRHPSRVGNDVTLQIWPSTDPDIPPQIP